MTAEPIGRVIADLRAGRYRNIPMRATVASPEMAAMTDAAADSVRSAEARVIDATAIYHRLVERDEPIHLYEDHPCIAPPFDRFHVCYENEHGNVVVMAAAAMDWRDEDVRKKYVESGRIEDVRRSQETVTKKIRVELDEQGWEPAEAVDWDRVRWTIYTFLFVGGRGAAGPAPTVGPLHLWRFLVYDDGEPADLHWVRLVDAYPMENWDMAHLVLLGAMNFLAARNVVLVEPLRHRSVRRRLARTGVTVHELAVLPRGRTRRSLVAEPGDGAAAPLTTVRGHFASYGPQYGRGLLFGKLAGRFWIPGHARGERSAGEHDTSYRLEVDA